MNESDEGRRAAEALAMVHTHQERTREAARLPWWVYLAMFVLTAGLTAINDVVTLSGSKIIAVTLIVVLVVVLLVSFATGTSVLGRMRGIEARQDARPQTFGLAAVVAGVGYALVAVFGNGIAVGIAGAIGLSEYTNTVAGVLFGAVLTGLFALTRVILARSR